MAPARTLPSRRSGGAPAGENRDRMRDGGKPRASCGAGVPAHRRLRLAGALHHRRSAGRWLLSPARGALGALGTRIASRSHFRNTALLTLAQPRRMIRQPIRPTKENLHASSAARDRHDCPFLCTSHPPPTAEDIVARYIQRVGGMSKIQAVKTLRRTGKFIGGGGFEAEVVQENKRPEMVRQEFIIQGMAGINAYDGKSGWKIDPFGGKKDPGGLRGGEE